MSALCRSSIVTVSKYIRAPHPKIILSLALLFSFAVCVLSIQWNPADKPTGILLSGDGSDPAAAAGTLPINPPAYLNRSRDLSSPRYSEYLPREPENPFVGFPERDMVTAHGDPYLYSYMKGEHEGTLITKSRIGGIVTVGPPLPRARNLANGSLEILRSIDAGLGGSFSKFFSNVMTERVSARAVLPESLSEKESGDENPFAAAIEGMKEGHPSEKAPPPQVAETKSQAPPAKDETQAPPPKETTPPEKPVVGSSGSVQTVRPYTLMRMEADGQLHAVAASKPREGTIESAELGLKDLTHLPFTNPAEYPMAIAIADLNGDAIPDIALHVPQSGSIRVFYGDRSGKFNESLRIQASRDPSSLVAADFDGDGITDLATSAIGNGVLTILYGSAQGSFDHFRIYWFDAYRDYIAAADNPATGIPDLVGMTFGNRASVLLEFYRPEGQRSTRAWSFSPAYSSQVSTFKGRSARLSSAALGTAYSVNIDSSLNQLVNVVNVKAGTDVYVVVGDLNASGTIDVWIALSSR